MKKERSLIHFHFLVSPFYFSDRNKLKVFLTKQLEKEGKRVETINYIFCSDDYLLQINQQFLKHDTLTDIITFEHSPKGHPLLSDIYISIERVKENALVFKTSFKTEIHRVIFHGALHLCGYKDKTSTEKNKMRQAEERWLEQYFVPRDTVSV